MTLPSQANIVHVLHEPHGSEHPYEFLPHERFPRYPLAGEAFIIGIATQPPGKAAHVTVHQWLNGVAQPIVAAVMQIDWQARHEEGVGAEFLERIERREQDIYQASLTSPAFGESLTYQIEAMSSTGERALSPEFIIAAEAWYTAGSAVFDGEHLTITQNDPSADKVLSPKAFPSLQQIEYLGDGKRVRRVRLTFTAHHDEAFFGLGERFNTLNLRGKALDVRCYEQYKNQGDRTYMPIPFLLSSAGYGIYVESSRWMQFDLAAASPNVWTLEADVGEDGTLTLHPFIGDPVSIIRDYTRLTGLPPLPPLWAFGLWMSGNEWNTQARVERAVQTSLDLDIPPSVLVIEAWSDETTFYIWNDAQYSPHPGKDRPHYTDFTFPETGKWRDPKAMVTWLHERGVRVLLWQVPVLKRAGAPHIQHDADRAYYAEQGFGVREADGAPYLVRPFWFRGGWLWDVTNPTERSWWLGKRQYLLDEIGIDGFKTDGGEHLWGSSTRFADGRRGGELWNEYPRHYTQAYYDFANAHHLDGDGNALTFSRAGFTGSQNAPLHWAGDENSTWEALRHSIIAGLSAAVSGISFWGWDFGGFSGDIPSAELYIRAAAMAAFCPVFQYHSEYNAHREPSHDRTPWNIADRTGDDRVVDRMRFLTYIRHNLMPYIWQEASHCAQTGEPFMRALRLFTSQADEFQYFFGRDLLVCPIVEPGATAWTGYLPPGKWHNLWTRAVYEGDERITLNAIAEKIPVFVRDGVELPLHLGEAGILGERVPLSGDANTYWKFE